MCYYHSVIIQLLIYCVDPAPKSPRFLLSRQQAVVAIPRLVADSPRALALHVQNIPT